MNIVDRLRVEAAVQRFEYHLELRGTRGRRRRDLRRELRSNLTEAAGAEGVPAALAGIGSPRALAAQVSELDASRPRWSVGILWAAVVFAVLMTGLVWTNYVMLATLVASGAHQARIEIWPWLGVRFYAETNASGVPESIGADGSPWWLLLVPVVFLLAAQPWRPWTHREAAVSRAQL